MSLNKKSLQILINIQRKNIQDTNSHVSKLYLEQEQIMRERKNLQEEFEYEKKHNASYEFTKISNQEGYFENNIEMQKLLLNKKSKIDISINQLEDRIYNQFLELKRFEIAQQKLVKEFTLQKDRKEQFATNDLYNKIKNY